MPNIHAPRPSTLAAALAATAAAAQNPCNRPNNMNPIQSYISAFESTYPGVPVEVKQNHREGTYRVFIRGDAGDRALTLAELQQATIDFQRGKA